MKITLCGSTKFYTLIEELKYNLEKVGMEVLTPPLEESGDYDSLGENDKIKRKKYYIDLHLNKIKTSDAILIANYDKNGVKNYIGANTFLEMGFAYCLGKKIYILHDIPVQQNTDEIKGLQPIILKGNVSLIKTLPQ